MNFVYNSVSYPIPDTLTDIPLSQYVTWSGMFGYTLKTQARDNALLTQALTMERMYMSLSVYTGIPYEDLKNLAPTYDVIVAYASSGLRPADEEQAQVLAETYNWNDEDWVIYLPEASVTDPVTEDEFRATLLNSKILNAVINGDWQSATTLCASYFRKEDESFSISLRDSRILTMNDLPLAIAFAIVQHLIANQQSFLNVIETFLDQILEVAPPIAP